VLGSFLASLRALFDPVAGVAAAVEGRRWGAALALLVLCATASGVSLAVRFDAARQVVPRMAESGELQKVSERELSENIEQARRVAIVAAVAKAVFVLPLLVLAAAVALRAAVWLLGQKASFAGCFSTAAVGFLPLVVFHLIVTIAALRQDALGSLDPGELLTTSLAQLQGWQGLWARVGRGADFFQLWVVALLGLGLAQATQRSRRFGLALSMGLYLAYVAVVFVALPGLPSPASGGHS